MHGVNLIHESNQKVFSVFYRESLVFVVVVLVWHVGSQTTNQSHTSYVSTTCGVVCKGKNCTSLYVYLIFVEDETFLCDSSTDEHYIATFIFSC